MDSRDDDAAQRALIRLLEQKVEEQLSLVLKGVVDVLQETTAIPEDELLTKALGSRLKNTNTVSAHVNVIVDAEPLKDALNSQASQAAQGELLEREPPLERVAGDSCLSAVGGRLD